MRHKSNTVLVSILSIKNFAVIITCILCIVVFEVQLGLYLTSSLACDDMLSVIMPCRVLPLARTVGCCTQLAAIMHRDCWI